MIDSLCFYVCFDALSVVGQINVQQSSSIHRAEIIVNRHGLS